MNPYNYYNSKSKALSLSNNIMKEIDLEKRAKLFRFLELIKMAFDSLQTYIDWFIDRTTLLDCIRHETISPWARAIHIGIKEKDRQRFLEYVLPLLKQAGIELKKDYVLAYKDKKDKNSKYLICIISYYDDNGVCLSDPSYSYTKEELSSLSPAYLRTPQNDDEKLIIPATPYPIPYLDRHYPDWRHTIIINGVPFKITEDEKADFNLS